MPWENNRPTHVPPAIRDARLARDGYRCVEAMRDGTRCTETTNLEAAHIDQWHPGETTTVDMVRTLCHWHHNRETQREAKAARGLNPRPTDAHPKEQHPAFR